MEALEEINIYTQENVKLFATVTDFVPNLKYEVEVTFVDTAGDFYIRLLYNEMFVVLMSKIPRSTLKRRVKYNIGDLVLYSEENRKEILKRGRVVSLSSTTRTFGTYEVFALDYGYTDRNISSLYMWESEIEIVPMAIKCQLNRCQPLDEGYGDWDLISGRKLSNLCANRFVLNMYFVCKVEDRLVVDLWIDGYNVTEHMTSSGWLLPHDSFYVS